jgi:hypothetical protein
MWTLQLDQFGPHLPDRVVLRLAPDAQLAAWETTIQAAVADQGYPTPAIRASDHEPHGSQRAWCVMDHATGTPLLGGLSGLRAIGSLPRLATRLPEQRLDALDKDRRIPAVDEAMVDVGQQRKRTGDVIPTAT